MLGSAESLSLSWSSITHPCGICNLKPSSSLSNTSCPTCCCGCCSCAYAVVAAANDGITTIIIPTITMALIIAMIFVISVILIIVPFVLILLFLNDFFVVSTVVIIGRWLLLLLLTYTQRLL